MYQITHPSTKKELLAAVAKAYDEGTLSMVVVDSARAIQARGRVLRAKPSVVHSNHPVKTQQVRPGSWPRKDIAYGMAMLVKHGLKGKHLDHERLGPGTRDDLCKKFGRSPGSVDAMIRNLLSAQTGGKVGWPNANHFCREVAAEYKENPSAFMRKYQTYR